MSDFFHQLPILSTVGLVLIFPVSVALTGVGAELSFSGVILVPLREIIFSLVLGGRDNE